MLINIQQKPFLLKWHLHTTFFTHEYNLNINSIFNPNAVGLKQLTSTITSLIS